MSATKTEKGFHITPEELLEWQSLTDEGEISRGRKYRKDCKKQGLHPTPPSKWLQCPVCAHRVPGSLISHYKAAHGGVNAVAAMMGVLPEDVPICTDDMMARFKEYGARSKDALAAKKAATA